METFGVVLIIINNLAVRYAPVEKDGLKLSRARKALTEVKLARDLLKKCAACFAKESR